MHRNFSFTSIKYVELFLITCFGARCFQFEIRLSSVIDLLLDNTGGILAATGP